MIPFPRAVCVVVVILVSLFTEGSCNRELLGHAPDCINDGEHKMFLIPGNDPLQVAWGDNSGVIQPAHGQRCVYTKRGNYILNGHWEVCDSGKSTVADYYSHDATECKTCSSYKGTQYFAFTQGCLADYRTSRTANPILSLIHISEPTRPY